jgi:ubiquinone/menaquinone biosynthesis C-methylase UbiE
MRKNLVVNEYQESDAMELNKIKQKRFYDSYCRDYDKNELGSTGVEPSKRRKNIIERRIQIMTKMGDVVPSFNVLEVGCGTGIYSFEMANYFKNISGLDISRGMLKEARKKIRNQNPTLNNVNVTFIGGDAENIPFKDSSFDCVMSINMLEHLDNIHKALEEMKRVVKRDGKIIISIPNGNCKFDIRIVQMLMKVITPISQSVASDKSISVPYVEEGLTHREISMDELIKLFGEAGIKVEDKAFMGFIPNEIPSGIASNWLLGRIEQMLEKIPKIREWAGVIIVCGSKCKTIRGKGV